MRKQLFKALKKKPILALVVGAVVFSSAFAFAATLGVTSASLGAGNAAVTSCTSAVTASYTVAYDTTGTAGFKVNNVKVSGLGTCTANTKVQVELTNGSSASVASATYTLIAGDITAGFANVPVTPTLAANVQNVNVAVVG